MYVAREGEAGKKREEGGLTDGAFYHGKAKAKYKLSFLYTLQLCICNNCCRNRSENGLL